MHDEPVHCDVQVQTPGLEHQPPLKHPDEQTAKEGHQQIPINFIPIRVTYVLYIENQST